jgi:hypothetical protein
MALKGKLFTLFLSDLNIKTNIVKVNKEQTKPIGADILVARW